MEEEKYTRMVQTYLDMVYRFALCYTNDVIQMSRRCLLRSNSIL